jgi:hypothetical protein
MLQRLLFCCFGRCSHVFNSCTTASEVNARMPDLFSDIRLVAKCHLFLFNTVRGNSRDCSLVHLMPVKCDSRLTIDVVAVLFHRL